MPLLLTSGLTTLLYSVLLTVASITPVGNDVNQKNIMLKNIYKNYQSFKEKPLIDRYYSHKDIVKLVDSLRTNPLFEVTTAGKSAQGRDIFLVKTGTGKKKIFMWAQMHGDEPTANAALFDLFNFLKNPGYYKEFRDSILANTTIWFMPLVNPDGAERFTRTNSQGIDLNRDAKNLATPEAKLLMSTFKKIKPHFAFNLHDQGRTHAVGTTGRPATISFLAPPSDGQRSIPKNRLDAMKLISQLVDLAGDTIPGHIGRYDDEFEPKAFGDTFQGLGAATILIESGGWQYDFERSFQRSINFLLFLGALKSITFDEFATFGTTQYESLPENKKLLYDLLLRNVELNGVVTNIGINYSEVVIRDKAPVYFEGEIKQIGKLERQSGYKEYDLTGLKVVRGNTLKPGMPHHPGKGEKLTEEALENLVTSENYYGLVAEGFTNIIPGGELKSDPWSKLPLNIITQKGRWSSEAAIASGNVANLLFYRGDKVESALINGFFIDVVDRIGKPLNTLKLR